MPTHDQSTTERAGLTRQAEGEPFTITRTPSDDPLDYVDDLEGVVREHLPPPVHKIALKWTAMNEDTAIEDFVNALEPHLRDRVPDFRALAAHVLEGGMDEPGTCCSSAETSEGRTPA